MTHESPSENIPHHSTQPATPDARLSNSVDAQLHAGVLAHSTGDTAGASRFRKQATSKMPPTDARKPGAEATLAFSDRTRPQSMEGFGENLALAQAAYRQTYSVINEPGVDKQTAAYDISYGEMPATQLHYAVLLGGLAARQEVQGQTDEAKEHFAEANGLITDAWQATKGLHPDYLGVVHQTRINMARRRAALLGLGGRPMRGMAAAVTAVALGVASESPWLARNNTEGLGRLGRLRARAKAFAGGIAAGVIAAENLPIVRSFTREASVKLFVKMEGMSWLLTAPETEEAEAPATATLPNAEPLAAETAQAAIPEAQLETEFPKPPTDQRDQF
ncbi:MAG TPA: hypothetical protein VLG16_00680 [Candidatus Saccharimonadales bacterium]|nr:hypothetical protein [Candidatus Saccharimonadales bacterium]